MQLTKAKKKINNNLIEEHGLSKNHKIMVNETKMKNEATVNGIGTKLRNFLLRLLYIP